MAPMPSQLRTKSSDAPLSRPVQGTRKLETSPRKALRGGIAKVKFQELALTFGDKCPQNGSENAPMAPRPHLGCPHEGSRVEPRTAPRARELGECKPVTCVRQSRPEPGHGLSNAPVERWREKGSGRDTVRSKDGKGTPTQSHISPSIPVYGEATFQADPGSLISRP